MPDSNVVQYTIQPGDNYWDIANIYNTTVEEIMAANPGIDPNNLLVGQVIAVPDPPPARTPSTPSRQPERRPEERRRGEREREFERRPFEREREFDRFRRPGYYRYPYYRRPYYPYRPYYPPYAPPVSACPPGATPYSVQPGESLYSIAARFGISVDAVIAANPYVNFGIPLQIGQVICLPV